MYIYYIYIHTHTRKQEQYIYIYIVSLIVYSTEKTHRAELSKSFVMTTWATIKYSYVRQENQQSMPKICRMLDE